MASALTWTRRCPQVVAEHQAPAANEVYATGTTRHYMLMRTSGGGYLDTCTLTGACAGFHAYGRIAALKRGAALWETLTADQIHARQVNGIKNVNHCDYGKAARS